MNKAYEFLFTDNHILMWDGNDAITFLAISMFGILLVSLFITNFITTPKKNKETKYYIPTSTNIKSNINQL